MIKILSVAKETVRELEAALGPGAVSVEIEDETYLVDINLDPACDVHFMNEGDAEPVHVIRKGKTYHLYRDKFFMVQII